VSRGQLIATGFGTSVVMWGAGYFARLPAADVPGAFLAAFFAVALLGGGAVAARRTGAGWRAGAVAMAITSLVNLLMLGGLLAEHGLAAALLYVPGTLLAGAVLGAIGGFAGSRVAMTRGEGASRRETPPAGDAELDPGNAALARVAVAATFMLLLVGGVVTSENAGLAVVDWPNSYGYNMFLYPLARMTGHIYFEHAHRLFGSLIGLTTLVLAIRLAATERRGWVKRYGFGLLLLVMVQGLLGGLRVTGHLTMSQSPADTSPSIALAVVHGVIAQLFLASLTALAAFTSAAWRRAGSGPVDGRAVTGRGDFRLALAFLIALFVQLVLGSLQRHLARGIAVHMMMAGIVAILGFAAGARAWGKTERAPLLGRAGLLVIIVTTLQLALGVGALVTTGALAGTLVTTTASVIVATAHQTNGALLLALAVLLLVWNGRLGEWRYASDSGSTIQSTT